MRDILADWRRWTKTERAAAIILLAALAAAIPALVNATALIQAAG